MLLKPQQNFWLKWHFLFLISCVLIIIHSDVLGHQLVDADSLLAAEVYQKVFVQHQSYLHFILMATPNFITTFFYAIFRSFAPIATAYILADLVELYLFCLVLCMLLRWFVQDKTCLRLYQCIFLIGITLLAVPHFWSMETLDQALFFGDHFMAMILGLFSLQLFLSLMSARTTFKNYAYGTILFTMVLVAMISDMTYIIIFPAPILVTLFLMFFLKSKPYPREKIFNVMMLIFSATLLGYMMLRGLGVFGMKINYSHIGLNKIALLPEVLMTIYQGFSIFAQHNFILFLLWVIALTYLSVEAIRFIFKPLHTEQELWRGCIYIFILAMTVVAILMLEFNDPDILINVSDSFIGGLFFRHAGMIVFLPIFIALPELVYRSLQVRKNQFVSAHGLKFIFILQVLILCFIPEANSLQYLFGSPQKQWSWLTCVNQAKVKYHLEAGLGGYWVVRPIMLYANIPMAAVTESFKLDYWITSTDNFTNKRYNFIAESPLSFSAEQIIQQYGRPEAVIDCSDKQLPGAVIFIYPKGITFKKT